MIVSSAISRRLRFASMIELSRPCSCHELYQGVILHTVQSRNRRSWPCAHRRMPPLAGLTGLSDPGSCTALHVLDMDAETVDETLELLWDGDRALIVVSSDLSHQHPRADSPPSLSARFNDGRFRVTTEAKLRPLARFGCSMVSRLISAFRAVRQPAEADWE